MLPSKEVNLSLKETYREDIKEEMVSINSQITAILTIEVMTEIVEEVDVVNFVLYVKFPTKQVIWLHTIIFVLIIILLFQIMPTAHNSVATTMEMHLLMWQVHIQLMIHPDMLIVVLQTTSLLT